MSTVTTVNRKELMSSDSIAKLLNKQEGNVRRTMKTLQKKGVISITQIEKLGEINGLGFPSKKITYNVNERDSYIVVAQLSPEFTAAVVDEWQELKQAQQAPALPDFNNPAIAARAWADEVEAKQIALTEVVRVQDKLQDEGEWRSLKAANLPQFTLSTFLKRGKIQTWRLLKAISSELGFDVKKVFDVNYGNVNSYHISVIAEYNKRWSII